MSDQVYLNGAFVPYEQAMVPVEDRGFQLADGIYEVVQVIGGYLFAMQPHIERLCDGAGELRIPVPLPPAELTAVARRLIAANGVENGIVYIQLTRGVATRVHSFPQEQVDPTLVMLARNTPPAPESQRRDGVGVITVPDNRWGLCYIKTIGLVPNVMAKQKAREAGAFEALFVREGLVTEGSSSNLFAVFEGCIYTYPLANILPGITRQLAIDVCSQAGIPVIQRAFTLEWLRMCPEAFLSSTTMGLVPISSIDGDPVGDGRPGPTFTRALDAFERYVESVAGRDT